MSNLTEIQELAQNQARATLLAFGVNPNLKPYDSLSPSGKRYRDKQIHNNPQAIIGIIVATSMLRGMIQSIKSSKNA